MGISSAQCSHTLRSAIGELNPSTITDSKNLVRNCCCLSTLKASNMELVILSDSMIRTYREAFTRFDSDGVVTHKELSQALRFIGFNPTEAELQDLINVVDKDGTGTIDFPEFLQMMRIKVHDQNQEEDIREAFRVFDNDGNGFIDRRELALMMRFSGEAVSESEIEEIIKEADVDMNGLIDYAEFFNLMLPKS